MSMTLIVLRDKYPAMFVNDEKIKGLVKQLTSLLAITIVIINNVLQPILSANFSCSTKTLDCIKLKAIVFKFNV
ncbi:unnamed protein product [Eruca vesicaria subsp. sativa]|uniref:Uncharacterized protein n=1 Tax=Eruca vesicaria subsp. sativa TaxID=29727 RepID=A0ABC8LU20_ERUVS|nr:unnamed protein product [Eruca vesicaria subsp. sativa]